MSRRAGIGMSGATLAGLSLATLTREHLEAQAAQEAPGRISLWSGPLRQGSGAGSRSTRWFRSRAP
jgi:hypothetical protein